MSDRIRSYETVYIVRPDVEEGAKTEARERVEEAIGDEDGEIVDFEDWGSREIAYDIQGHEEGVTYDRGDYQLVQYEGPAGLASEVERQLNLLDTILKFMTVQLERDVAVSGAS